MSQTSAGVVSVVLVNYRGVDDTLSAIAHLREIDWPRELLEIVVVENGSGDDSEARLRAEAPDINLVVSKTNRGFAGGSNLGVSASRGEFVAFLNNDAKPEQGWIRAAVAVFGESPSIGAVASKVLDWDGSRVDYIGSAMTWFGMGYKPLVGEPVPSRPDAARDVLFGTGSAMFVRRSVFDALGGFDERYFMFFEDVDLGWRLNLRGWRFRYEPLSVAYHKHHASMAGLGAFKESYLLERNALFTQFKNLDDAQFEKAFPAGLLLSARRAVSKTQLNSAAFEIRDSDGDDSPEITVPKEALVTLFAMDQFVEHLPGLRESRAEIQESRVVGAGRIWQLFGDVDAPSTANRELIKGYEEIVASFDVLTGPSESRVLIVTGDPIGAKMAGPAIRAWHMAQSLSARHAVTLASLSGVEPVTAPFDLRYVRSGDQRSFTELVQHHDVIVFQGHAMAIFDALRETDKVLVVDVYDPMHLEQLEQGRELGREQWNRQVGDATDVLNEQLLRGDFFLCASERQRHFYLGQLAALGRVNPSNYADDPGLEKLIAVVPFGLDPTPPRHDRPVLKGVVPGIGADDKIIIWSGGLYNWFDPKTLITAVARLGQDHPEVRLFFLGTKHPHPGVPEMGIVAESRELARELGVLDRLVFFNDSWVDFADRGGYLVESSAGVSTHFSHVETTFSFRTRILDYLWAELPMVVTAGDHFADLVERESLGIVVEPEDVDALQAALAKVLFDESFAATARANIERVRLEYAWDAVLAPFVEFVNSPRPARDRLAGPGRRKAGQSIVPARRRRYGVRHDLSRVFFYLRNGGPSVVVLKVRRRLGL